MTDKSPVKPQLWTQRSVEETMAVYDDWAASYDADLVARGYHTPRRIAEALVTHLPDDNRPILDFGCGTGMSGAALRAAGASPLHGTDITQAMLDEARPKGIYEKLWLSSPGTLDVPAGTYRAIVATGVISLGAAPPETIDLLLDHMTQGDVLALSFNDPTLENGQYDKHLQSHIDAGHLAILSRTHGPHIDDVDMGSDVIVLKRLT